ncbi:MAG TPA: hypothetical protein PL150_14390 [Dermatophilaceae bacterium]|jgi:hypothetical protein|nr:hypothetical protein [Dermatophilaceae bacterium]
MTRPSQARAKPLHLVLAAIGSGVGSRGELTRHTGLAPDVVDAAVDHLVSTGRLTSTALGGGCATGGCGACPSGRADAGPGCGVADPRDARGPVVLTLAALATRGRG